MSSKPIRTMCISSSVQDRQQKVLDPKLQMIFGYGKAAGDTPAEISSMCQFISEILQPWQALFAQNRPETRNSRRICS
ncbi:hypothetical protein A1D30_24220 [Acidovorax sp. GW101-3H11]|nr:hypothetical protein A1D30_24220 [Acidovorax sp. GW101-3H11]